MFCSKCGSRVGENTRFCSTCGAELGHSNENTVQGNAVPFTNPSAAGETVTSDMNPDFSGQAIPNTDSSVYSAVPNANTDADPSAQNESIHAQPEVPSANEYAQPASQSNCADVQTNTPFVNPHVVNTVQSGNSNAQSTTPGYAPYAQQAPMPQKRRCPVLAIVIGIIALAIVAAGSVFGLSYFSDEAIVLRALKNTGTELFNLFDDSENFSAFIENTATVITSEETCSDLKLSADQSYSYVIYGDFKYDYSSLADVAIRINSSEDCVSANGKCDFSNSTESEALSLSFDVYCDTDELSVSVPDLLDDSYSVPLKKIGQRFLDSDLGDLLKDSLSDEDLAIIEKADFNLFHDESFDAFKKSNKEVVEAFKDSVSFKKADKQLPGCDDDIKVYRLVCDKEAWQNLNGAYKKYVFEGAYGISFDEANTYIASALEKEEDTERLADIDFDLDFYIGIDDGYVKAFHVEGTVDGEEGYLTAKLNGKDIIWDDVKIYTGDEPDSNIGLNFERNDGDSTVTLYDEKTVIPFSVMMTHTHSPLPKGTARTDSL